MKNILLLLFLFAFAKCEAQSIQDSWYKATATYTIPLHAIMQPSGLALIVNGSTQTYDVTVKVESSKVTAISFGDGKEVRDGFNTYGYTYIGGELYYHADYTQRTVYATTTVIIRMPNTADRNYDIQIK